MSSNDQPRDENRQNPSNPQWGLHLDETNERKFVHGATKYGVEVHGGTPDAREAVFREQFDEPLVVVDGREADSEEDLMKSALIQLGAEKEELENRYSIGSTDIRRALTETENNFVITEFDAMDRDTQTNVAQMIKAIAEGMDMRDTNIMLGFSCAEGGAVVRAEHDLSIRIRSWEITPGNDDYDPLATFEMGDMINTSERETPMEVVDIELSPQDKRIITAENHHGRYQLRSHNNGSISMRGLNSKGTLIGRDVEVSHAE